MKRSSDFIFHPGAKVRDVGPEGISVEDNEGLLKWLAKDRAMIVFKDMNDINARKAAFERLLKQWIKYV